MEPAPIDASITYGPSRSPLSSFLISGMGATVSLADPLQLEKGVGGARDNEKLMRPGGPCRGRIVFQSSTNNVPKSKEAYTVEARTSRPSGARCRGALALRLRARP